MGKKESINTTKIRQTFTKYIASIVHNAMEDFHTQHLSDAQMKELNPIIRNAIYSALYVYDHKGDSEKAQRFVEYHLSMIPKYWEEPELVEYLRG